MIKTLLITSVLLFSINSFASANTQGYAWSESVGWFDLSNVVITDTNVAGHAYNDNTGFLSFADGTSVTNSNGTLSGFAWSESVGWFDFSNVTISNGTLTGYAYNDNTGFLSFVDGTSVTTTWTGPSASSGPSSASSRGGGGHSTTEIYASCQISDTTIKVGEEINIDIDIEVKRKGSKEPYTFKWSKILEGSNSKTTHTFTTAGEYIIQGQVSAVYSTKTVTCDTVTVSDKLSSETTDTFKDIISKYKDFLTKLRNLVIKLPANVVLLLDTKSSSSTTYFTRDLELRSTGPSVTSLQNLLIAKGYAIPAGATGYFGEQTRDALIKLQQDNNISPAIEYFGPFTR